MDKKIRSIEAKTAKVQKSLKELEKLDKSRDKVCALGKKVLKKKK